MIYGLLWTLFTVKRREDVDMRKLVCALSFLAQEYMEYILANTNIAAEAEYKKNGKAVWPLENLPNVAPPANPIDAVWPGAPLVLRASALLEPALPELAPFLVSVFGSAVIVPTTQDALAFREKTVTGKCVKIVALDGMIIVGAGAFGGIRLDFSCPHPPPLFPYEYE